MSSCKKNSVHIDVSDKGDSGLAPSFRGAGLYCSGLDQILVTNCSFEGNQVFPAKQDGVWVTGEGGGMAVLGARLLSIAEDSYWRENLAYQIGGALWVRSVRILHVSTGTIFESNRAGSVNSEGSGIGGVFFIDSELEAYLSDIQFIGNYAGVYGGALTMTSVFNKLTDSNDVTDGGFITSCQFIDNYSE